MCDCITEINEKLPDEYSLRTLTNRKTGKRKAYVAVMRRGESDTFIAPNFCPFCGEEHADKAVPA